MPTWRRGRVVSESDSESPGLGFILTAFAFFPLFFHGGLGHLSALLNNGVKRLLGGRVVSVATLPVMVSRLGWGSRFKSDPRLNVAGSLVKS